MAKSVPAFVSYSRKDSEFALRLARDLEAAGVDVWLDQLKLIPGQVWDRKIEAAVMNNPCMIVILSPASVVSEEVANEFNFALDEGKTVIPVFHRDCNVPFRLRRRQRADFRHEYARGFQDLLRALASGEDARPRTPTSVNVGSDTRSDSSGEVVRPPLKEAGHDKRIPALLVTLHGGSLSQDPNNKNVRAYDQDGNKITSALLEANWVILNALRGIHIVGKHLYVANANKTQNSLLCYERSGTGYRFVSVFASNDSCDSILHPFDFAFDGLGYCYLSSQNTNVVTRLRVSDDGRIGSPAPIAAALPASGTFLPGTFVASSNGNLSIPATQPVESPAGLAYSSFGAQKRSVRGLTWAQDRLYVADLPAGTVKIYDARGDYLGQSNEVESPRQLVVHDGSLYVSGGDHVMTARLPSSPDKFVLKAIRSVKVKNSCGMTFGPNGHFFVASRTEKSIQKFDPDFKPMQFNCDLPDDPEFLLHV